MQMLLLLSCGHNVVVVVAVVVVYVSDCALMFYNQKFKGKKGTTLCTDEASTRDIKKHGG